MKQYSITLKTPVKCPFRGLYETPDLQCYCGVKYEEYHYCTKCKGNLEQRKCDDNTKFPEFCPLTEVE